MGHSAEAFLFVGTVVGDNDRAQKFARLHLVRVELEILRHGPGGWIHGWCGGFLLGDFLNELAKIAKGFLENGAILESVGIQFFQRGLQRLYLVSRGKIIGEAAVEFQVFIRQEFYFLF